MIPARLGGRGSFFPLFSRQRQDRLAGGLYRLLATLPLVLLAVIILALWLRTRPILEGTSISALLLGETWRPMQGQFGFLPFLMGTVWVTGVGMLLAIPPCLLTAIYLAEYASPRLRAVCVPLLDLLAAIPSVVYGVWGILAIVPWVQHTLAPFLERVSGGARLFTSENPTGFSVMAGGIVLAVMVAPFIISVTFEVLHSVPSGQREAALALGTTRWQAIKTSVLPVSVAGLTAGVVLGASRALGETIAVLMVVGNVVQIPHSLFDAAYPLPALIANNYGEMMSIPRYDAALLGAALLLLVVVLVFNVLSTLALRQLLKRRAL